jgi:hypothetical protein
MAIVSDVEIRLRADIARLQQDMNAMRRTVDNGMSGVTRTVEAAKKVLAGFGAGMLLKELVSQVIDTQREFDKLNASLITATGSTAGAAQAFGALQKFAATTPYSVAEATEAFIKLRNLGLTPSEAAMTSYGNTASSMGKGLNQMIEAVADAATGQFERLKEFGVTAKQQGDNVFLTFQGVTKKIGNNSKEIQGYLRAIGDVNFAGAMEKRMGTLDGAISNLGDTWAGVLRAISSNGFGEGIMGGVLALSGALQDLSDIITVVGGEAHKEGEKVKEIGPIHATLTATFKGVAAVAVFVTATIKEMGSTFMDLGNLVTAVGKGDWESAKKIMAARQAESDSFLKNTTDKINAIGKSDKVAQASRDKAAKNTKDELAQHEIVLSAEEKRNKAAMDIIEIQNKANGIDNDAIGNLKKMKAALDLGVIGQKEYNAFVAKTHKEQVLASDAYKNGAKAVDMSTEAIKRRAQAQEAANKADQAALEHQKAMGSLTEDDFITASANNSIKALEAQKKALQEQQGLLKGRYDTEAARAALATQMDAKDQEIAAAKIKRDNELDELDQKRYRDAVNHTADIIEAAQASAKAQQDATRDMQDEVDALGLTGMALAEVTAARKRDQAAELDRRANISMIDEETAALHKQADELRAQADLGLTKERVQEQQKRWSDIESVAHDVFLSIGDSSKSLWQRMKDSAKTLFFDWLYSMTLKKWIINIGASIDGPGAVAGLMGGSGSGGGAGGALNLISAGQKIYEGFTSGFAGIGSSVGGYITQLGDMFGSTAVSSFGSGMSGAGGIMAELGQGTATGALGGTGTSTAAMGWGQTASAGLGVLGGVAGGVFGGRMISGGYGGNGAVNTGTAIGAAVGSVVPVLGTALGALVGGLLGGAYNRLFGYKDKEIKQKGIAGNFDMHGFDGNTYADWTQKGGWFRSDKHGQDRNPLDDATQKAFNDGFALLKSTTMGFASTLGVTADAVNAYSKKINLTLTGDAAKDQKAITDLFTTMSDELAAQLVPSIGQFAKAGETASTTLQRVATDFKAIDAVMSAMGRTFGAVGTDSIAARERLVDLSGGIEAFGNQAAFFVQNFYSEADKAKMLQKPLQDQMAALGLSTITTTAQFKDAVLALDLTTEAGAKQYAAMMALAPQFKAVADYMAQAQAAADALAQQQAEAAAQLAQAQLEAAQQAAEAQAALADAQSNLQAELMNLQGQQSAALALQRQKELAGVDASLRPMYERIYALQDEKAALDALHAREQANTDYLHGLMDQSLAAVGRAVDAQKNRINAAFDASMKSFDASISAVNDTISKTSALSAALKGAIKASPDADNGGAEAAARAQIQTALAIAKASGVLPSPDDLAAALQTVGQDSSDNYSTYEEYARAVAQTNNALESLGGLTDHQLDTAQQQLKALNDAKDAAQVQHDAEIARLDGIMAEAQAQVDAVNGVNTSVLSVAAAVAALQTIIGAIKASPAVATDTTPGAGGILSKGPVTIEDLYKQVLGRAPDAGGLQFWKGAFGGDIVKDQNQYLDFLKGAQAELSGLVKAPPDVPGISSGTMAHSSAMLNELQTMNERLRNVESATGTTATATGQFAQQFHQVSGGGNALATENV